MKFIFIIFLVCATSFASAVSEQTQRMHDYILKIDFGIVDVSLDKIITFIDQGADINEIGQTGADALHLVTESWAYSSRNQEKADKIFEIMEYLLAKGANPSTTDFRGGLGLWFVHGFAKGHKDLSRIADLYIRYGVDLNQTSAGDGDNLALLIARIKTDYHIIDKYLDSGLDILVKDNLGQSVIHLTTKIKKTNNEEKLYIEYFFENLPTKRRSEYAKARTKNGMTPLHFAVQVDNLDVVKLLIEKYQVDIAAVSAEGMTPIDIAKMIEAKEIYEYLTSRGARPSEKSEQIFCDRENTFKTTYEKIKETIEKCRLKTIDSLLAILPKDIRSNYTLSFFTHAVQQASKSQPHINLFSRDGKIMIALNGDPSHRGYRNLEIIQFRDQDKTFEFRDIEFPRKENEEVLFSDKNPLACLGCHGNKPKPLWDNWVFWPGKYRGEIDSLMPTEKKFYEGYKKKSHLGRYQYLKPRSSSPIITPFGSSENILSVNQNLKMDTLVEGLMAEKVASEIMMSPVLSKHKYTFLAALSCEDDISSYVPSSVKDDFMLDTGSLKKDTAYRGVRELSNRMNLLIEILGGLPESRYAYQDYMSLQQKGNMDSRSFDQERTVRLRYVAENLNYDMSNWYTAYNNGLESYMPVNFSNSGLEKKLWDYLMKTETDSYLVQAYKKESESYSKRIFLRPFFYKKKTSIDVCKKLKEKALEN